MEDEYLEGSKSSVVLGKRKRKPSRKVAGTPSPAPGTRKRRVNKENKPPTLKIMPTIAQEKGAKTPKGVSNDESQSMLTPSSAETGKPAKRRRLIAEEEVLLQPVINDLVKEIGSTITEEAVSSASFKGKALKKGNPLKIVEEAVTPRRHRFTESTLQQSSSRNTESPRQQSSSRNTDSPRQPSSSRNTESPRQQSSSRNTESPRQQSSSRNTESTRQQPSTPQPCSTRTLAVTQETQVASKPWTHQRPLTDQETSWAILSLGEKMNDLRTFIGKNSRVREATCSDDDSEDDEEKFNNLPLDNQEDLEEFNGGLKEPGRRNDLRRLLRQQGGSSWQDMVFKIMPVLLTCTFSRNFTMEGRTGKIPFQDYTRLVAVIIQSVIKSFPEAKVDEVGRRIGRWLTTNKNTKKNVKLNRLQFDTADFSDEY